MGTTAQRRRDGSFTMYWRLAAARSYLRSRGSFSAEAVYGMSQVKACTLELGRPPPRPAAEG